MSDWNKVKSVIATVAPGLATALGGPLAGVAASVIADKVLGKPTATDEEIQHAILGGQSPELLLKLKEAERQFLVRMRELEIDLEKVHSGDRDSARKREIATGDWTPRMIAAGIIIVWAVVQWHLLTAVVDPTMRELVARLLGTLDAAVIMVLNYYFGSSAGSKAKTDALERAAKDRS